MRAVLSPLRASLCVLATLMLAPHAQAQCVGIANGDILVLDLLSNTPLVKITDVTGANLNSNQEEVCTGGSVDFPRAMDFDPNGRIWITEDGGILRVDPQLDDQVQLLGIRPSTPLRGIVRADDGDLFAADPHVSGVARINRFEPLNGIFGSFGPIGGTGAPLGLIRDRQTGAGANDMLVADNGNFSFGGPAALLSVDGENGAVTGIARAGFLGRSFRAGMEADSDYVYLTDHGGLVDPDDEGPMAEVQRTDQVVRIDRTVAFDFSDDTANGLVNQMQIWEGAPLVFPIGIIVLDEDGVAPDTVLVADGDADGGDGAVYRIDFDPTTPNGTSAAATSTITLVARGFDFSEPWELKKVEGINPLPRQRIFVTDGATTGGVQRIDPGQTAALYVGGLSNPTGITVDPANPSDLIVANADSTTPEIVRVTPATATTGTATTISSGGSLMEPTGVIIDSNDDIVVIDRAAKQLIRIDPATGVQTLLSPMAGETDFFINPIAVALDVDGYFLVADQGDGTDSDRLIQINPVTGQQFCVATEFTFPISGIQDLAFDDDTSAIFSKQEFDPLVRAVGSQVFAETTSNQYETPRGVAIAENQDIVTVDAGNESTIGDGRVLRLDPIGPATGDAPEVVGGESLADPFGIAVDQMPRPNPVPADTDGDGVFDLEDNCVEFSNPGQEDTEPPEGNGVGDACDPPITCDINGDASVGLPDVTLLLLQFGNDCNIDPLLDCSADCAPEPDMIVGLPDFSALIGEFGNQTGVSGALVNFPATCPVP